MGYLPYSCGFQRLTTSGVVSDSGKPILVCATDVESGATAAVPWLVDGTATGSAHTFPLGANLVSQGNIASFNLPVMFPLGCYVSFDANTTAVTVFYILQSVTS